MSFWNIKNLVFSGIVLTVFLGSLEVLARLNMDKPQTIQLNHLSRSEGNPERISLEVDSNAGILYESIDGKLRLKRNVNLLIKNHQLSHMDVEISTNSLGLRYEELEKKTADHFRILVLGDSITLGDYVPYEETYPAFLEYYLKLRQKSVKNLNSKKVQVINAGVGAIGITNEFSILMETGLTIHPDIVLVGLYLNDFRNSISLNVKNYPVYFSKSYLLNFILKRFQVLNASFLVDEIRLNFSKLEGKRAGDKFLANNLITDGNWKKEWNAFNKMIYLSFYDWGFAWSQLFWTKIKTIMKLMQKAALENGFELNVFLLPNFFQVVTELNRNFPQKSFELLMTELGIPHLDILPALRNKFQNDGKLVYFDECHMTPEGNRFVSELLGEFLIEKIK